MNDPKVTVLTDEQPTLEEAQKIVGGYVELIQLPNGDQMYVDEDGIRKGLPINREATDIVYARGTILGNVLILKEKARWVD